MKNIPNIRIEDLGVRFPRLSSIINFLIVIRKCGTIGTHYASYSRFQFICRSVHTRWSLGNDLCFYDCSPDSHVFFVPHGIFFPVFNFLRCLPSNPGAVISVIGTFAGSVPSMLRNLYRLFSGFTHRKSMHASISANPPAMDDGCDHAVVSRYSPFFFGFLARHRSYPLPYGFDFWRFDLFAACARICGIVA
jgi:hypothetical protein